MQIRPNSMPQKSSKVNQKSLQRDLKLFSAVSQDGEASCGSAERSPSTEASALYAGAPVSVTPAGENSR